MSIHQAIKSIDDERETLVRKALKNGGWKRACDAPGSYWYWYRDWKGVRWSCWTDDEAYQFERRAKEQDE